MSYYESPSDLSGRSFGPGSPEQGVPRLRSDLIIREQRYGPDELFYVIKDPISREYFKLPPVQWDLYSLFDGSRTVDEIIDEYNEKHPREMINEDTIEITKQDLRNVGLLDVSSAEKNLMLMERIRSERKLRVQKKDQWTLEYMILFSVDPDKFLDRVIPKIRFLWSRQFFIVSMIAIVLMLVINVVKWNEFWRGTIEIYSFHHKTLWDVFVFFFLFTVSLSIHELGHAMTMKHYGGECHQIGFMLFYLSPAFFADAADAYMLESRKQRIWFSLSGVYSEALMCCIATFVWFFTPPGTAIHDFAFLVFLFMGITGFLMNLNPLVRLDGYYILADVLGIDELREESLAFVKRWFRRTIFRLEAEEPAGQTRRKRRIFLIYGILTLLYTITVYLLLVLWLKNIYSGIFGSIGSTLFVITLLFLFRKKIREAFNFLKLVYLDKKEIVMRKRRFLLAGIIVLLLLMLIPKSHMKISSAFVLEPEQQGEVRCQSDGFVQSVLVKENDSVKAGQVLARLTNPQLNEALARIDSSLGILERQLSITSSLGESSDYQMKLRTREQLLRRKQEAQKLIDKLVLKAPVGGTVLTARIDEKVGTFLNKGSLFCVVANIDKVKVQIPVSEYGIDDVRVGQPVILKLNAYPTETFRGDVQKISPAIAQRVEALEGTFANFNVVVLVDNKSRRMLPGMEGDAKILAAKHSIAGRALRELVRGIASTVW